MLIRMLAGPGTCPHRGTTDLPEEGGGLEGGGGGGRRGGPDHHPALHPS